MNFIGNFHWLVAVRLVGVCAFFCTLHVVWGVGTGSGIIVRGEGRG